jgi:hypothetical protein
MPMYKMKSSKNITHFTFLSAILFYLNKSLWCLGQKIHPWGFDQTERGFSLGTPVSSNNKTDLHDITEILLKVALNTIKPNHQTERNVCVGNKPLLYILQITVNPYFNSRNYC